MHDEPETPPGAPAEGEAGGGGPGEVEVGVLGPVEVRGTARPLHAGLDPRPGGVPGHAPAPGAQRAVGRRPVARPGPGRADPALDGVGGPPGPGALGRRGRPPAAAPRRPGAGALRRHRLAALLPPGRPADPAGWREALALVRGRPFEGLRSPDWTVLEGVAADGGGGGGGPGPAPGRAPPGGGRRPPGARGGPAGPAGRPLRRAAVPGAAAGRRPAGQPGGVEAAMDELLWLVAGEANGRRGPGGAGPQRACTPRRSPSTVRCPAAAAPRAGGVLARL